MKTVSFNIRPVTLQKLIIGTKHSKIYQKIIKNNFKSKSFDLHTKEGNQVIPRI